MTPLPQRATAPRAPARRQRCRTMSSSTIACRCITGCTAIICSSCCKCSARLRRAPAPVRRNGWAPARPRAPFRAVLQPLRMRWRAWRPSSARLTRGRAVGASSSPSPVRRRRDRRTTLPRSRARRTCGRWSLRRHGRALTSSSERMRPSGNSRKRWRRHRLRHRRRPQPPATAGPATARTSRCPLPLSPSAEAVGAAGARGRCGR